MYNVEPNLLYGDNIGLSTAMNPDGDKMATSVYRHSISHNGSSPDEWGIQSQYIHMTIDQKITTPTKGLPGDRGHSEHGSMDKEHCCFFCSRGSICFQKSAPFIAHESMLQFLVLSQDTLFLPDDSFFSLYRVFGVTEVFNEVPGDLYVFVPGGAFSAFRSIRAFYYPFINVPLSMPMWQFSSLLFP
jgi:hypothetical protein